MAAQINGTGGEWRVEKQRLKWKVLETYAKAAQSDVTALMTNLAPALRSAKWTSVLPSIIDAAERDLDIADMYSKLQRNTSMPFEAVIDRAVSKGELPKDTHVPTLIAALTGALFYRRWFSQEPLTDAFCEANRQTGYRLNVDVQC